eukprot:6719385-Pyramimonas_sp.AAC.1
MAARVARVLRAAVSSPLDRSPRGPNQNPNHDRADAVDLRAESFDATRRMTERNLKQETQMQKRGPASNNCTSFPSF